MPVTNFQVRLRRALAGGRAFGDVGPYEELKGRLDISVDPDSPANQHVTDLSLAPRSAAGRVSCGADVSLLLPADPRRASGRAMLDVVNRGNTVTVPNFNHATRPTFAPGSDPDPDVDVGDGFLMRRGYAVLSCGWQFDVPEVPGLLRLRAPEALGARQSRLTGRVWVQLQTGGDASHLLLSDRGHAPYEAADLDDPSAVLTVQDQLDGEPTTITRSAWRFARADGHGVVPDRRHVWLEGGFERGRIYRIAYTAVGAPVVGLGIVALRDAASWLKHGGAAEGHPAPGAVRAVYGYGRSQTGRLLRTWAYHDLNQDEDGREALDGLIANVAGGMRGEFNQRFGQNSKDRPQMMAHLFPFADQPETDAVTGRTGALHHRLDARRSPLKAMYTNTSAEYHRGDASLIHTDPDGTRDRAHGANVRIYHFAGTEHGLGTWPPTDRVAAPADPVGGVERTQHLRGTLDYGRFLRACLDNLDRWVTEGVEPPPSRHPRVADGTAVPPETLADAFARIPDARFPKHHARPQRLDFGADAEQPGWRTLPPLPIGAPWGSRVAAVDEDGNERGGLAVPELAVPLATHTGWNLRHPDIGGAEQLLVFAGATLPFPRTRVERESSMDPRRSIAERYPSRDAYLDRVREAARALVAARYMLAEDVELSAEIAGRMWDHWTAAR